MTVGMTEVNGIGRLTKINESPKDILQTAARQTSTPYKTVIKITVLLTSSMKQKVIDNVRIQQTKHLVLDTQKALENSAQLEEEKILQQKEMMREVGVEIMYAKAHRVYQ